MGRTTRCRVSGYTKSNGTYVKGYTRSLPSKNTISTTRTNVHVHGYTRNNGTHVNGYIRNFPSHSTKHFARRSNGGYYIYGVSSVNMEFIRFSVPEIHHEDINFDEIDDIDSSFNRLAITTENINMQRELSEESKQKILLLGNINDLICPISHGLMFSPIKTTCDHTFDKIFLEEWMQINNTCPLCRKTIDVNSLAVDDNILKKITDLNLIFN